MISDGSLKLCLKRVKLFNQVIDIVGRGHVDKERKLYDMSIK